jgi:hypothetical protein
MPSQKQQGRQVDLEPRAATNGDAATPRAAQSGRRSTRSASRDNGLGSELDRFVSEHPDGWNHDDWLGLLGNLRDRGFETSDPDAIGLALEGRRRN